MGCKSSKSARNISKVPRANPLLLADILDPLFKFVSSSDLLKFRPTSKEWNKCAERKLKNRHDVEIILGGNLGHDEKFLKYLVEHSSGFLPTAIILRNYDTTNKNKKTFPKIKDEDVEIINRQLETSPEGYFHRCHEVIVEICKILGTHETIKRLEVDLKDEPIQTFNYGYLLKILGILSPSLELLEFIGRCEWDWPSYIFSIPEEKYSELLAEFNNKTPLQKLRRICCCESLSEFRSEPGINEWFQLVLTGAISLNGFEENYLQLDKILILSRIGRLSQISFDEISIYNLESLDVLLKMENPTLLSLELGNFEVDVKTKNKLERILDSHKENLTHLNFSCLFQENIILQIPEMPELTYVLLTFESEEVEINFANTPKLKSFLFSEVNESETTDWDWKIAFSRSANIRDGKVVPCTSLRSLLLPRFSVTDPDCWKYLYELFPAIEALVLRNLSGDFLQEICRTNWQENLTILHLNYCTEEEMDVDQILFGIDRDWKYGINTRKKRWWKGIKPPQPAIANLTHLKNLRILTLEGKCNLTNFSVYLGLARMKSLRSFGFERDGENGLTPEAMKYLEYRGIHLIRDF